LLESALVARALGEEGVKKRAGGLSILFVSETLAAIKKATANQAAG